MSGVTEAFHILRSYGISKVTLTEEDARLLVNSLALTFTSHQAFPPGCIGILAGIEIHVEPNGDVQ